MRPSTCGKQDKAGNYMQRFSSAVISIFQSPVVESESLASIDQADLPFSLTKKHLSYVFTRLKINHHISIIDRASDISRCRGAAKFRYIRKIPRNSQKHKKYCQIRRNLIEYMSVQHI